ncbi:hypothetical protein GF339_21245 [candidate division KSB3 bacterium]|uniref:Uncharacterized protein n=1 Tax=candidate division KSB3 bacterium TaxID=2044937 RepID=A0A9D5K0J7_9BACT|nr:hypothetical protein [candidate division KSB3 bacterium]MBD3327127.1 hypothetical protein [candidate division KSB3 bacterium]
MSGLLFIAAIGVLMSNLFRLQQRIWPFPEKIQHLDEWYPRDWIGIGLDRKLSSRLKREKHLSIRTKYPNRQVLLSEWRFGKTGPQHEDTRHLFYAAVHYLYAGRTLFLPSDQWFYHAELLKAGGLADIKYYQPHDLPDLSEDQIRKFPLYHRFIYNPYFYSPIHNCPCEGGVECDNACPNLDFEQIPILLLLIPPEDSDQDQTSAVVALPCEDHLCFLPQQHLRSITNWWPL